MLRDVGGNVSKFARQMGIDYVEAREKYAPRSATDLPKRPGYPPPADIRILGKPGMKQHVIAIKEHVDEWPCDTETRQVIAAARRKYDAGTHIMCQGRHPDGWTVLYLIPRRRPRMQRPYFSAVSV